MHRERLPEQTRWASPLLQYKYCTEAAHTHTQKGGK